MLSEMIESSKIWQDLAGFIYATVLINLIKCEIKTTKVNNRRKIRNERQEPGLDINKRFNSQEKK